MHFHITIRLPGRACSVGALLLVAAALPSAALAQVVDPPSPPAQPQPPKTEPPAATAEPSAQNTSEVIPLGRVEVRGQRNLFDEQAARRRKLLDESAPCLGCDAKPIEHHRKLLERVADYALDQVTPQAAPEANEADRLSSQVVNEAAHPTNSSP